jgi:prepilin signal peptidase PulO-like enzyme (type II secretory pathway)
MSLFLLGSIIGSFLNVLIDRLPHQESIAGRSRCDYCGKTLTWKDLIPVVSFIWTKGKSRCCNEQLSFFYPVVEFVTGTMFAFSWFFIEPQIFIQAPPEIFQNWFSIEVVSDIYVSRYWLAEVAFHILVLALVSCFIVMLFADLKYYIIPDGMQIGAFLSVFFIYLLVQISVSLFVYKLISSIVILFPILLLYLVTRGRGMGFADVKYAGFMGFLLGVVSGFWALYISFLSGAIISVFALLLKKKHVKSRIPFGPFLIFGTLVVFLFPNWVYDTIKTIFYY